MDNRLLTLTAVLAFFLLLGSCGGVKDSAVQQQPTGAELSDPLPQQSIAALPAPVELTEFLPAGSSAACASRTGIRDATNRNCLRMNSGRPPG